MQDDLWNNSSFLLNQSSRMVEGWLTSRVAFELGPTSGDNHPFNPQFFGA
jgi:hypothetical protein